MSYYTEQDPLLPKDQPAPEIHGSRPQSIRDVSDGKQIDDAEISSVAEDFDRPSRRDFRELIPIILGICVFISFTLISLPTNIPGDERPVPRTIDERVNRILTDTPLIGKSPPWNQIWKLTSYRWSQ